MGDVRVLDKALSTLANKLEALREDVPVALVDDYEELISQVELLKSGIVTFIDSWEAELENVDSDYDVEEEDDEEDDDDDEDEEYEDEDEDD